MSCQKRQFIAPSFWEHVILLVNGSQKSASLSRRAFLAGVRSVDRVRLSGCHYDLASVLTGSALVVFLKHCGRWRAGERAGVFMVAPSPVAGVFERGFFARHWRAWLCGRTLPTALSVVARAVCQAQEQGGVLGCVAQVQ